MHPSLMQRVVIAVLRLQGRKRRWSDGAGLVQDARRHNAETPAGPPPWVARRVRLTSDHSRGFAVHTLSPAVERQGAPTVLYLHGGGYIHDFARQHWSFMASLVEASGATVIAPQYPLAPQHSWRDSYPQVLEIARGVDAVAGDSAGGGFALAIAQSLAAEGTARDAVLISPLLDLTMSSAETERYDQLDPWLSTDGALHAGRAWAAGDDIARPELSPLFGSMDGLGRVLVFTGTRDVLHPQALELLRRLPDAQLVVEPGCVHNYPILPIPEAATAQRMLLRFLHPQGDATSEGALLN